MNLQEVADEVYEMYDKAPVGSALERAARQTYMGLTSMIYLLGRGK